MREDGEDDVSDEERVDMSAISGAREREERREKFYAVQQECRKRMLLIRFVLNCKLLIFKFQVKSPIQRPLSGKTSRFERELLELRYFYI